MKTKNQDGSKLVIIGVIVFIILIGVFVALTNKKSDSPITSNDALGTKQSACEILNPILAIDAIKQGSVIDIKNKLTKNDLPNDMKVTSCEYLPTSSPTVNETISAILILKSPSTKDGVSANQNAFLNPPKNTQPVTGYGSATYWDPATGQLNVLSKNNWYVITFGKSAAKNRTLEQTKLLANILNSQF